MSRTRFHRSSGGHFRDLHQIQGLARLSGFHISVIDWPFSHRGRTEYAEGLAKHLAELGSPKVVLLDPDTGIAPKSQSVWQTLGERDWLLLYQHARRAKGWVEDTRAEFNACCDSTQATIFRSRSAPEVVFFAAQKAAV
jgi:hypothetical protein